MCLNRNLIASNNSELTGIAFGQLYIETINPLKGVYYEKNNHYIAYNGKPHPSNITNLALARGSICSHFKGRLKRLNQGNSN